MKKLTLLSLLFLSPNILWAQSIESEEITYVKNNDKYSSLYTVNSVADQKVKSLTPLELELAALVNKSGYEDKELIKEILLKGDYLNDAKIISYYASSLENGFIFDKNIDLAIEKYKKAIELGDLNSKFTLAQLLINNNLDNNLSSQLFESFYKNNPSKKSAYAIASIYYDNNKIEQSIRWLTLASNLGSEKANAKLGVIYSNKDSIFFNRTYAIKYLTLSSQTGNIASLRLLQEISQNAKQKCIIENLIALNSENQSINSRCKKESYSVFIGDSKLSDFYNSKGEK